MGSLLFDVVNFSENHSSLIIIPFIFVFGWDLVLVVKSEEIKDKIQSIHVRREISSHYRKVKKINGIFHSGRIKSVHFPLVFFIPSS